jgi:1,4-dihydroxy-2-naphthoyl-CoA synthase
VLGAAHEEGLHVSRLPRHLDGAKPGYQLGEEGFTLEPGQLCPEAASPRCEGTPTALACSWPLACDFRILAVHTKVGLLETRFGLLPDMGATVHLPRIVGESRARQLILLGDIIDAAEALRIGLANQVVADADLDAGAAEMAE